MLPLALRGQGGKVTELTPPSSFQSCSVMMYPAGPGSGDSPEGFPEQPRRQSQIGNCTAQTRGTETGRTKWSLLYSVVGQQMESGKGEYRIEEVWVAQSWWKNWSSFMTYILFCHQGLSGPYYVPGTVIDTRRKMNQPTRLGPVAFVEGSPPPFLAPSPVGHPLSSKLGGKGPPFFHLFLLVGG